MEKTTCMKIILSLTLILFLFMSVNNSAFGCGGGGKRGGKGGRGDTKTTTIKKFTRAELEKFFDGLPDNVKKLIISKQVGKDRTLAQLNLIRGIFFEAEKFRHESDEAIWQSYEDLAVLLDKTGQNAELVLTFVTGGTSTIVTGTLFGTVRAGADEYSKGKSVGDIIQAMAIAVAADKIMKVKGLAKLGDRGGKLVDMVWRANKLNKNPKVVKYLAKVALKAGIYKGVGKFTKKQIGNILKHIANAAGKNQVVNTTPVYSHMDSPGPVYRGPAYDINRITKQKMMH